MIRDLQIWLRKYIFNKDFVLVLAEAALPLLVTYAMFIVSDEGKNLYNTMESQLKGEQVKEPLGASGWFIVISLPLTGILWLYVIAKRYKEKIETKPLGELQENINNLTSRLEFYNSNFLNLTNGLLYSFADELKLNNADRVTVYARIASGVNTNNYEFLPVARYAGNPDFRSKGRASYPGNQGVISKAWQDGSHFNNSIPSHNSKNDEAYLEYQEKTYGINRQVASNIRMKSRFYYGWRIKDSSGKDDLAVIILESTTKSRFTEKELNTFFETKKRFLREFVTNIKPLLPSNVATASGF